MLCHRWRRISGIKCIKGEKKIDTISIVKKALNIKENEIIKMEALKKGMTNHSFLATCVSGKYIVRIPGEGTDRLIDRKGEAAVYQAIEGKGIGDEIVFIDPVNGYKVTRFFEGARCCNAFDMDDIYKCMKKLRMFHEMELVVERQFDIFGQIVFYESLWNGTPSVYSDYQKVKEQTFSLRAYIEAHTARKVLTHIDAVPDNFLFVTDEVGREEIHLIDWEYAGMQDPHVDIAMFCVYSFYDRLQVDRLIQAYFTEGCSREIRIKIYAYISVCGLLWSNWCEYKHKLGVAFGEYAVRQYRYAKEYYQIVQNELRDYNE